ncbi:MAG: C39 family peptidase [Myxococcota bacterium]
MLHGLGSLFHGLWPTEVAASPEVKPAAPVGPIDPGLPLAEVSGSGLADLIRLAKRADVPRRIQSGPTCGLFAIGMVMDFFHTKDPQAPTAIVSEGDEGRKSKVEGGHRYPGRYNFPPTTDEKLLGYAQSMGLTQDGELYDADNLAKVAAHFGYRARVRDHAKLDDLYAVLDAGRPAIIAIDYDLDTQRPADNGGVGAHYVVIEGYFDQGGERYLVAKHGDNRADEDDCVWSAAEVETAWNALHHNEFYAHSPLPPGLELPKAGPHSHDIEASLNAKLIELIPPDQSFVLGGRDIAAPS